MKNNILIASAITAGTVALAYFVRQRMRTGKAIPQEPMQRSRHLTGLFAKAKHIVVE